MKTTITPLTFALLGTANAGTIVRWYGCDGEYEQTITNGDGECTNIGGWKTNNLCGIWVPPEGKDTCEFYTTYCWVPWHDTYYCNVSPDRCNAGPWQAISSYKCWTNED
ncbi:hypothetical protein V8F20_011537 [Naviculisporaceae sp. PSN 640]